MEKIEYIHNALITQYFALFPFQFLLSALGHLRVLLNYFWHIVKSSVLMCVTN